MLQKLQLVYNFFIIIINLMQNHLPNWYTNKGRKEKEKHTECSDRTAALWGHNPLSPGLRLGDELGEKEFSYFRKAASLARASYPDLVSSTQGQSVGIPSPPTHRE